MTIRGRLLVRFCGYFVFALARIPVEQVVIGRMSIEVICLIRHPFRLTTPPAGWLICTEVLPRYPVEYALQRYPMLAKLDLDRVVCDRSLG